MKVLIVEDNAWIAMHLEDELREAGFDVIGPATTSRSARDYANDRSIDCALIDIDLDDGRSGGELAQWLRDEHDTPTIFVTGYVHWAFKFPNAAIGVLTKPVEPAILVEVLVQLGRGRQDGDFRWPDAFIVLQGGD